jgi:hypothetical protein
MHLQKHDEKVTRSGKKLLGGKDPLKGPTPKVSVSTPASRATYSAQYSITTSRDSNNNLMKTILHSINLSGGITLIRNTTTRLILNYRGLKVPYFRLQASSEIDYSGSTRRQALTNRYEALPVLRQAQQDRYGRERK